MIRRSRDALRRWCNVLGVTLHEGQIRVIHAFADGHRFLVVVCGRRWGKTLVAFVLAMYGMLEKDARVLVVSKTYRLASRVWAFLVPQVLRVFGAQATIYRGSYTITTAWGAQLVLGSADHPDSLLGEGWDLVVFDECATCSEIIWQQYLRPALIDRKGCAVFITTPRGHNWVYNLFDLGQKGEEGHWSIQAPSSGNPHLAPEELAAARRTTDPTVFAQEFEASFVTFVGRVYSTFSWDRHVIDKLPDVTGWSVDVAVDPGYANMAAILFIYYNEMTGEAIVFDEMVEGGKLNPDMLQILNARRPPQGYDLEVCDIAARKREGDAGASFLGFMRDHGHHFRTQSQGIVPGVNVVRSLLLNVENEVRLKFYRPGCPKTISSMENYHYPEPVEGRVSEEPEKDGINDHACDALRYWSVYRYARKPGRSFQT